MRIEERVCEMRRIGRAGDWGVYNGKGRIFNHEEESRDWNETCIQLPDPRSPYPESK